MTEEERRIISGFVERVAGVAPAEPVRSASPWGMSGGSSVPSTQTRPPLPPVDREADQLVAELFARYPEARYRITQTAFVQEAALVQAQNRIQDLEWEVENARREGEAAAQPRGMFGGMFGGGARSAPPMPPRPRPMAPPYDPGVLQQGRSGPGFLGTALMTAAGVAGGLVLGNALMGMFGGGGGAAHAATGETHTGGGFGQEAVPTSSPWTDPTGAAAQDAAPVANDLGGTQDDAASYDDASGFDDAGGYDEEV